MALELASARLAERLAPELGTSPSSAVDLGARLRAAEVPFSRELAEEHVERTARALENLDLVQRLSAHRRRQQRRLLIAAGVAAAASLAALAMFSHGRRRLLGVISAPGVVQLVDVPLAADIRITYHYPAYTQLPVRVIEGGDGSIAAVRGTEVDLAATTDEEVRSALFKSSNLDGTAAPTLPMHVSGRSIGVRFMVTQDARYHFALTTPGGDKLEERVRHAIHAVPDAYPEVTMLAPAADVELHDTDKVAIAYAARDDFGVARLELVVEMPGSKEPKRLLVAGGSDAPLSREGSYIWQTAELGISPGGEARFYLEATDNDAVSGPKRARSAARKLTLFSAEKHHEDLLAREQHLLDGLVDWLGLDLTSPYALSGSGERDLGAQRRITEAIGRLNTELNTLVPLLAGDKLAGSGIAGAFANVREHVQRASRERSQLLRRLTSPQGARASVHVALAREQRRAVTALEKDVIYLDDLLAIARIDTLKHTAKDLLAAQRELQRLLAQYKKTQDPDLRAELMRRIRELKEQMLNLLARMATIKEQLPGEYRNLESASQLAVSDQLQRLERALKEDDLDTAGRELERLADMIENMSDRLGKAEEEYGGERYNEIRKQLSDFARQFEQLEDQQRAVAKRSEDLAKQLRDKTLQRVGGKIDDFIKKARKKTAEALSQLDSVQVPQMGGVDAALGEARERLLDLDGLLAQKDFAEALKTAGEAVRQESDLGAALEARSSRYGPSAPEIRRGADAAARAERRTREVEDMLAKLFPDPSDVLSKEQLGQMRGTGRRQADLEREAQKLAQKMDQLAENVPLFGGEPRASLQNARGEMGEAASDLGSGELPGGARHSRLAADELGKLRQALEQASKSGKGGLPLPLAMSGPGGQGEGGEGGGVRNEDVHIPESDKNRAAPQFRKELMEAAKQKAPQRYEDAVRHYYEELIR